MTEPTFHGLEGSEVTEIWQYLHCRGYLRG